MTTLYRLSNLASTYGNGTYDSGNYNGTNVTNTGGGTTTTGGGNTTTGGGNSLTDTGVLIALTVGVATATLLVAMIVRIWRRPSQKPATVTVESDSTDTTNQ
jgi:hypothetical protein